MTTRYFVIARTDCKACGGKISTTLHTPAVVGRECCEVCGCKGYTEKLVDLKDVPVGVIDEIATFDTGNLFAMTSTWDALGALSDKPDGSDDSK